MAKDDPLEAEQEAKQEAEQEAEQEAGGKEDGDQTQMTGHLGCRPGNRATGLETIKSAEDG